ncbi:MAG TPA: DPP IV N-terminal domain-containing protein, partial [Pirellulaceae bacterium]|nr:DPP IV N-terminal domain-containing protein [Pirellulaceae bacterium]
MSATRAGMQDHPSIVEGAEDLPNFVPGRQQLRRALQLAPRSGGTSGQVTMSRLVPHWSSDERLLWYRKELPEGQVEFIAVDTELGTRRSAFDHAQLASALSEAGVARMTADRLAIREFGWDAETGCWVFRAGNRYWSWADESAALTELTERPSLLRGQQIRFGTRDIPTASARTGPETHVTIVNETPGELFLYWRDANGERREYGTIAAGESRYQHTFAGHVWEITDNQGRSLGRFMAGEEEGVLEVTGVAPPTQRGQRDAGPRERPTGPRSPDGRWTYTIRDYNLFVAETGGEPRQVSFDGSADARYEMAQWAPDSRALVAFRVTPATTGNVFLVESSPAGGGRAQLRTNAYHLPGDPFPTYELNLFTAASWEQVKPPIDRMEFGRPRLRWYADGHRFRYRQVDRGHQRFRVIEVDAHTGSTRNLIDERSETFIWTAHSERPFYHEIGDEAIIYSSERDGWNHLYWVDVDSGENRQLTRGEHVVRGIDRVDESARQVWYRVSGLYAEQDPYFIHFCRIGFDGGQFTALTDGTGT